jgi:outer membrane protein OmpA-like peptidoglycan-associated protein
MNTKLVVANAMVSALLLAGCTAQDDPNRRAKVGAAVGAVAGAVIGHQVNDKSGKWVGAAVGALAGAGVGNYMDNQQREFESALAEERRQNELEIERMKDDTLKLILDSEVSFDFNKSEVKPAFRSSLDKLANVIVKYDRTIVHVIGHTDSVGDYLIERGVPTARLRTEGRGEDEPRDSNATEAGRQLNRRVEIFLKPVVEGEEQRAYEAPRYY